MTFTEWARWFAEQVVALARERGVSLSTAWEWRRRMAAAVASLEYPEQPDAVGAVREQVFSGSTETYTEARQDTDATTARLKRMGLI